VNKKCYVGFHATNKEYDKDNYFGSGIIIGKAIKKYGIDNFIMGIIEYIDFVEWKEKESFWIKEMNSHVSKWGYNQTWGGEGNTGYKFNDEQRKRSKEAAKNRPPVKEETKTKLSKLGEGRKASEKCKAALLKAVTGRKKSKEELVKISRKDSHHSKETKEQMIKTRTGVKRGSYIKIKCPYCNREIIPGNFKKWHGENCKHKK
jgi:group I intron endonuclease